MIHCQKGKDLLLDLKRSDWLPPYDEEGFRSVLSVSGLILSMRPFLSRHIIIGNGRALCGNI
jgi:hypothetical protein